MRHESGGENDLRVKSLRSLTGPFEGEIPGLGVSCSKGAHEAGVSAGGARGERGRVAVPGSAVDRARRVSSIGCASRSGGAAYLVERPRVVHGGHRRCSREVSMAGTGREPETASAREKISSIPLRAYSSLISPIGYFSSRR